MPRVVEATNTLAPGADSEAVAASLASGMFPLFSLLVWTRSDLLV